MSNNQLAWSHSRCETYNQCPHKFYRLNILKDVPFEESEAMRWGKQVHKALELRLKLGVEMPSNMAQYEDVASKLATLAKGIGAEIHTELQFALDKKLKPCGWFDKACWTRGVADLMLIKPDHPSALIFDYKTGKKKSNDNQLALMAAHVFEKYPHIERVGSAFIWLKEGGEIERADFRRENKHLIWKTYLPIVRKMQDSVDFGDWPMRPSGLCGWCPVNDCPNWRPR